MKKWIIIAALLAIFPPASSSASVFIQLGWGCSGEYTKISGYVPSFKALKYEYDCEVTCCRGEGTRPGKCTGNFNDKVVSIDITANETVRLYQDTDFGGMIEEFSGTGCYDLRTLARRASSAIVYSR